jgi:hypothetical protein
MIRLSILLAALALSACAARPSVLPVVPAVVTQLVPVPVACAASADASGWRAALASLPGVEGKRAEVQVPTFRAIIAEARRFIEGDLAPAAKACGVTLR